MNDLLKQLKLGQLPNGLKFLLAVAIVSLLVLTPSLPKLFERPTTSTVSNQNTNTRADNSIGISNKGIEERSATTTIVGNNNNVVTNSNSNSDK